MCYLNHITKQTFGEGVIDVDLQYSIGLMRIAAKEIGMDFLLMSELDRAMQRMQKKVTPEMAHKAYKEVFSLEVLNF